MGDQQPNRNTREDHLPGLSLIGANPCVLASHQAAPCLSVSIVAPPSCPVPMGTPCPTCLSSSESPHIKTKSCLCVSQGRGCVRRSLKGLSVIPITDSWNLGTHEPDNFPFLSLFGLQRGEGEGLCGHFNCMASLDPPHPSFLFLFLFYFFQDRVALYSPG